MRPRMRSLVFLVAALLLTAAAPANAQSPLTSNFRANLSGANEVPANASEGEGVALFRLSEAGDSLSFKLNVSNLTEITMAHIHRAPAGSNGGVVVWLFPATPPPSTGVNTEGTLAEGIITAENLVGPLEDDWEGFIRDLRAGNLYVNVHTTSVPGGEIRGQIRANGRNQPSASCPHAIKALCRWSGLPWR